ncbi:MAG: GNAT family N-acetyltransferase [Lachnospiraceae bacterium]|nr:GNAT family N-acetyltransferase [Lachnospiraceae bacterium]
MSEIAQHEKAACEGNAECRKVKLQNDKQEPKGQKEGREIGEVELLTGKQILATRPLWGGIFSEDSAAFVDYYYRNKAENNVCFVIRNEACIRAMLFLTPYELCVRENQTAEAGEAPAKEPEKKGGEPPFLQRSAECGYRTYPTYYIVGVATRAEYRHRGYMTRLLDTAFDYMRRQRVLFTFLMPANPAIYEPFGFRYIYERENYRLRPDFLRSHPEVRVRMARETDGSLLADFAMWQLTGRYGFFIKRDEAYYRLLCRELASENGGIFLVYVGGELAGYYMYAREEEEFLQEVLFGKRWEPLLLGAEGLLVRKQERQPIIMAKYLGDEEQKDELLEALACGKIPDGFVNEVV